ncbi:MAG: prephenate dehydratase [Candidatus Aenigmarchaeota archaeon]|nr:prephenate dehydratase [Candidatus Aenigmarchaeota archaeon]
MDVFSIAYQGEPGAYSEEAILSYIDSSVTTVPCETFQSLLKAVSDGKVDYGLLPVENTLADTIWEAYELLMESYLRPCKEIIHRINHCLIGLPDVNAIRKVYSHPAALAQCTEYIKRMGYEALPELDTAGSVRKLKEGLLEKDAGTIASERAAQIYGMKIIARDIEDNPENYTRFFLLGHEDSQHRRGEKYKTSIVLEIRHEPGALYEALGPLAKRKINMTKLQSRRIIGSPWEFRFIIDLEGHRNEKKVNDALKELEGVSTYLKIMGSYPEAKSINSSK